MDMRVTLTPELAYASGKDAGNRSMRKAGRTAWNEEDANVAAELTNRLLIHTYPEHMQAAIREIEGLPA
jgi:hypothetical protein